MVNYCALSSIFPEVLKSSIYGLLRPNGAGKISFIFIINQIIALDEVSIWFNGEELNPFSYFSNRGYLSKREKALSPDESRGETYSICLDLKVWIN